jgi:hypothetical protein
MLKQSKAVDLHLCHPRAEVPGGSQIDRERDFARTMRQRQLHLVNDELERANSVAPAPTGMINRLRQILDLLLGRGNVWVERRHRSTRN